MGVAFVDTHGAVDVDRLHADVVSVLRRVLQRPFDQRGERRGRCLGGADVLGESDRPAHRAAVFALAVFGAVVFGQAVPASDQLRGVAELDLAALCHGGLEVARHVRLVDGEHEHLVVGEQVLLDGFAESEAVELGAEHCRVAHVREDGLGLGGLALHVLAEHPWGGGHVEPPVGFEVVAVVDLHEVRFVGARQGDARGPVGLVTHDHVEPAETQLLGLRDDVDRLVGGEHDGHAFFGVLPGLGSLVERLGVGGGRLGEVDGRKVPVVGLRRTAADAHIGADRERPDVDRGLGHPLPQRLGEQLNGGHEEQHAAALADQLFGDLHGRERLAGTASHDELSPIMLGEPVPHRLDRRLLVGPQPVGGADHHPVGVLQEYWDQSIRASSR